MNTFKKYCPNVWVAECEEEHAKGEIIELETKYGKEVKDLTEKVKTAKLLWGDVESEK